MSKVDDFAEDFADAVRKAFIKVYGEAPSQRAMSSVMPSWSERASHLNWTEPNPLVVVVLTEHAWVGDIWRSTEDHDMWERAAKILTKEGWGDVSFDSINPGVQVVFIDRPQALVKNWMKRAQSP